MTVSLRGIGRVAIGVCLVGIGVLEADEVDDWAKMKTIVPRGYVCLHTAVGPRVDGKLDDAAWKQATSRETGSHGRGL